MKVTLTREDGRLVLDGMGMRIVHFGSGPAMDLRGVCDGPHLICNWWIEAAPETFWRRVKLAFELAWYCVRSRPGAHALAFTTAPPLAGTDKPQTSQEKSDG